MDLAEFKFMKPLTAFTENTIKTVLKIPKGRVATYSQIAGLAGKPQASRGVSWILHSCSKAYNLPWHRVLNAKGQISFPKSSRYYKTQKQLLEKEGVRFDDKGQIDMKRFQWKKQASQKRTLKKTPTMFG